MADQGPLSNTVLGGRYRLGVRLGSGGFADVYLAEHIHLKTQCAIKVLTRRLTNEEIEQFRREAQTIAALDHPHILRVRDFDLENGFPFLVMDYAPNGTLRSRHPRGTRLPLVTVVAYVKQIADALQHAHDQKLIHRDLKPENLLIGKRDEILLSDFGIAIVSQSTSLQPTQGYAGTAAYSAPEQLKGKPQRASDQYALGIIVYEWLTGEIPFKGSFVEVFGQQLYEPPPLLRDKVSTLQPEMEQVVLTALAKKPEERFATVRAFANALEQAHKMSLRPPMGTALITYRGHSSKVN